MSLKNTADRYGHVAQLLHWVVVALIIGQFVRKMRALVEESSGPEERRLRETALQVDTTTGFAADMLVYVKNWNGHGQITITVRAPRQLSGQCASCRESFAERYVEIAVSDTGAGIAPEHLPRLFEPFFSTKEVGKGTGMGLAVTHGVVHRVGGHILIDTAPGSGTTVRLLLRAAQAVVRAVPAATPAPAAPAPRVACVLVVDDEPLVMGLISEVLESHGYAVVGHTDSRQALAWARSPGARFDLLVTDQTMPGLTGVELARELLAMRPMLPVVLCTGFSESVDARVAAAMGIRHFFSKPIPLERLVAAVDTLVNDGPAPAVMA